MSMNDDATTKRSADEAEVVIDDTKTAAPQADDVVFDTSPEGLDDSVVAEEAAGATIKKLREALKSAQKERDEYLTGWQRTKADYINAKKRAEEDFKEARKYAVEGLIEELLPVLASFDMAMANKEAWQKVDTNWRTGVEYIRSQLGNALATHGLTEVVPEGKPFDPMRDEAVRTEPVTDPSKNGMILSVIQKGYTLNGKQIRAPKVVVGETKETM